MKDKIIAIIRIVCSVFIMIVLLYFWNKMKNIKIFLIPFLLCSLAMVGKNIFLLLEKQNYAKIFHNLFILSFFLFLFGFLAYWCYISFISKEYVFLVLSLPFWIFGITTVKKKFFSTKNNSITSKIKVTFNFKIIVSSMLVILVFLSGILMLILGITDMHQLNKKTKEYRTTKGYYKEYASYNKEKNETSYKLIYRYEVDGKEYLISTDYGTNYIPDEESIREVKFNPNNPEEAILVGTSSENALIFMGAFFVLVSFVFVILALTIRGCFDKLKINVMGTYLGVVFIIVGIGSVLFQNGTTMSFLETVRSFGLWIVIPFMFIVVGIIQLVKSLFLTNNKTQQLDKKKK